MFQNKLFRSKFTFLYFNVFQNYFVQSSCSPFHPFTVFNKLLITHPIKKKVERPEMVTNQFTTTNRHHKSSRKAVCCITRRSRMRTRQPTIKQNDHHRYHKNSRRLECLPNNQPPIDAVSPLIN